MQFLFLKILDNSYQEEIFLALESVGINKASYFDATNLDAMLEKELPIFQGFFNSHKDHYDKIGIISAVFNDNDQINSFLNILRESGTDIDNKKIIRLVTLPINFYFE